MFTISLEDMLDQSILKTIGISKFHYNIAQFSRNSIMILVDNIFFKYLSRCKSSRFHSKQQCSYWNQLNSSQINRNSIFNNPRIVGYKLRWLCDCWLWGKQLIKFLWVFIWQYLNHRNSWKFWLVLLKYRRIVQINNIICV